MGGSPANVRAMRAIGLLCQDAGLRVVEAAGWVDRGRTWGTLKPEYVIVHHTAAPFDIDRMLIEGRSDLPGPLCSFALHADGTVVLIASGLANHCGVASISSTEAYGIEATGPVPVGASGPVAFPNYDEYITLCAAIRLHHGWGADRVLAHKEIARPDGRKPDPAFGSRAPTPYPDMDAFRAAVDRRVRTWGVEEDWFDMATKEELRAVVAEEIKAYFGRIVGAGQSSYEGTVEATLRVSQSTFNEAAGANVKAAAIATRVAAIEDKVEAIAAALPDPAEPPSVP